MEQLTLFTAKANEIALPEVVSESLEKGAALAISISGGKDSQALLNVLSSLHREHGFPGRMFAIHADLGRAEWPQTSDHVRCICEAVGAPLIVVQRSKGDLVARMEERLEKCAGTDKPFWPSATNRYCTSHLKSGPIDIELRASTPSSIGKSESKERRPFWPSSANRYCTSDMKRGPIDIALRGDSVVISAEGVRADESAARAKKPVVEVRVGITAGSKDESKNLAAMTPEAALMSRQPGQRVALNWRPLLHWNEADIWRACGTDADELEHRQELYRLGQQEAALEGWPCHPAYVMGNQRLSCALCILGSQSDLKNGAEHNPEVYGHYLELEARGGATFKHNWSLAELDVTGEAARLRDEFLADLEASK